MKIVKACDVVFRPEGIYVTSFANTDYGLIGNVPYTKFSPDVTPVTLGSKLLALLQSIPETFVEIDFECHGKKYSEHMSSLGFKTGDEFEKSARSLMVKMLGDKVAIVPDERSEEGGFITRVDQIQYTELDAESLGKLVLERFNSKRR